METFNVVPDGHLVTYVTALGVSRNRQVAIPVLPNNAVELDLRLLNACRVRGPASDLAVDLPVLEKLSRHLICRSAVRDVGLARRRVVEDDVVPRTQIGVHLEPAQVLNVRTVQSFVDSTSVPFGIVVGVRRVRELRVLVLGDRFRDDLGLIYQLIRTSFQNTLEIIVGVVMGVAWILRRHVMPFGMLIKDS